MRDTSISRISQSQNDWSNHNELNNSLSCVERVNGGVTQYSTYLARYSSVLSTPQLVCTSYRTDLLRPAAVSAVPISGRAGVSSHIDPYPLTARFQYQDEDNLWTPYIL